MKYEALKNEAIKMTKLHGNAAALVSQTYAILALAEAIREKKAE